MSSKVYIETSVVSYFTARPSRDIVVAGHQQTTHDFWSRLGTEFEPYVSALVIEESGKGDAAQAEDRLRVVASLPVIRTTPEVEALAQRIIVTRGVPEAYPEDALHIALATVGGMDFLVTWNFTHINNPFTRMVIRKTVENEGYVCPEIVSPDELLGAKT